MSSILQAGGFDSPMRWKAILLIVPVRVRIPSQRFSHLCLTKNAGAKDTVGFSPLFNFLFYFILFYPGVF